MTPPPPLILYDGTCRFCRASVRFILRRDRRRTARFATLDGRHGRAVVERHPELEGVDSLVWVEGFGNPGGARIRVRSDAVLRVARYLGGLWPLLEIFRVVPRPLRDAVYSFVARHRRRLAGRTDSCFVPRPEDRHRFLDDAGGIG